MMLFLLRTTISCSTLVNHMSSGPVIAMEVRGDNAISKWKKMVGPENVEEAKEKFPACLRAKYGIDQIKNGFYGCDIPEEVERVFFNYYKN